MAGRLALAAALTALAAACSGAERKEATMNHPESLAGLWVVEDVDHGGVIDMARLDINFSADGRISGRGGCNRYTGAYDYKAGAIKIGPLGMTRMACAPALMNLEQKFVKRLETVSKVKTDETGALILSDEDGRILARKEDA